MLGTVGKSLGLVAVSVMAFIALLIGGVVVWWMVNYPSYTHRYRLKIEVLKEGHRTTGSGVLEVTWRSQPAPLSAFTCELRGDAIPIGTDKDRLVALLRSSRSGATDSTSLCTLTLRRFGYGSVSHKALQALALKHGQVTLDRKDYPAFATFSDDTIPSTGYEMTAEELPARLGATVAGVWLEFTDQKISRGEVVKIPAVKKMIAASNGTAKERRRSGARNLSVDQFTLE
jgi:hypothetical protein